jgi:hypothetical protein
MQTYFFDAARNWAILAPPGGEPAVRELAAFIGRLRAAANLRPDEPPILDGLQMTGPTDTADETGEIIINYDADSKKNAFAWRSADTRIEIYAHSPASLANAVADFIGTFDGEPAGESLYRLSKKANHSW